MGMDKRPVILAVDQAKLSGFAVGRPGDTPKSGTITIPKTKDDCEYYFQVRVYMRMLVEEYKPDVFALERPFFAAKFAHSGVKLIGTAAVVKGLLHEMGISDVYEIDNASWKKTLCGTNRFNKKTRPYPPIDNCEMRGWNTGDSNDRADAFGIWLHTCNIVAPDMNLDLPLLAG